MKNFALVSPDGLVHDILIHVGKDTVSYADIKQHSLGGTVVKELMKTVISKNSPLFTDRHFTILKVIDIPLTEDKLLTRTVNANRTEGASVRLPNDKDMNRGEGISLVRDDGKVSLVKWRDNRGTLLLPSAVGTDTMGLCKRWSKEHGKKIPIPQPAIVPDYKEMDSSSDHSLP